MQKGFVVIATFLLLSVFLVSSVSAATFTEGVRSFMETGYDGLFKPFLQFLFGSADTVDVFFARILIFTILLSLVWISVRQFPGIGENAVAVWVISVAVALLGTRFLNQDWIATIALPYSALGIAMTAFFPLAVFFFFVEKGLAGQKTLRKIAWIFAAVVFVALYFSRAEIVEGTKQDAANFLGFAGSAWIYMVAAGVCILFLLADKTLQRWFSAAQIDNASAMYTHRLLNEKLEELQKMDEAYASGRYLGGVKAYTAHRKRLLDVIKNLKAGI